MNSRKVEIIFESPCTFGFGLRHRINRVLGEKVYTWCRGVCKKRERKQKQLVICALRVRCTQSTIQSVINPLSHPPRGLIVPLRHPSSQTTTIPVSSMSSKQRPFEICMEYTNNHKSYVVEFHVVTLEPSNMNKACILPGLEQTKSPRIFESCLSSSHFFFKSSEVHPW